MLGQNVIMSGDESAQRATHDGILLKHPCTPRDENLSLPTISDKSPLFGSKLSCHPPLLVFKPHKETTKQAQNCFDPCVRGHFILCTPKIHHRGHKSILWFLKSQFCEQFCSFFLFTDIPCSKLSAICRNYDLHKTHTAKPK